MNEIQKADPRAKRKAIWMVCISTLLGVCLLGMFQVAKDEVLDWLSQNTDYLTQHSVLVFLVALAFMSPVILVAFYLFILGKRIIKGKRFPPPHMAVVRDTRILTGAAAIQRGRIIQALSLMLMFAAGTVPYLFWQLIQTLN